MSSPHPQIRDALFGDLPLDGCPPAEFAQSLEEPWITFAAAREMLATGQTTDAIDLWRAIAAMPNLESRHYAQAWHFLRAHGAKPPEEIAKTLLGIVVEVGINDGVDLLAAYPDHTARYIHFNGRAAIWEHPDASLDPFIDELLSAAQPILQAISPWPNPRPAPPPPGIVRINLLSPAGLHFGHGPMAMLGADHIAKPTFDAATALMQQLIQYEMATKTKTNDNQRTDSPPERSRVTLPPKA